MKKVFLLVIMAMVSVSPSWAQCAMCRASLENNLANGELVVGASINVGIMYLFVAPYLALATLAYFWYRTSKKIAETGGE